MLICVKAINHVREVPNTCGQRDMSLDLNGANYLALTGEIEGRVSVLEVAEEHGLRERLNLIDNIKMFRLERDGNDWRVMVPHGHPRQRRRNRGGGTCPQDLGIAPLASSLRCFLRP